MARIILLNAGPTAAGTYAIPSTAIPQGVGLVTFDFDVTDARDGDNVQYTTEMSFDGGSTWQSGPSGLFRGGIPHRLDGQPIVTPLISTDKVTLPQPTLTTRRIRGSIIVTGITRNLSIGITLS